MADSNVKFCSILLKDARSTLRKYLPDAALHSIRTSRSDVGVNTHFYVEVPPNEYLTKGLQYEGTASCAAEAKTNAIMYLFERIEEGKLEDDKYPIVLLEAPKKKEKIVVEKKVEKKNTNVKITDSERKTIFRYVSGSGASGVKGMNKLAEIYEKYKGLNDIYINFVTALFEDDTAEYIRLKSEIQKIIKNSPVK